MKQPRIILFILSLTSFAFFLGVKDSEILTKDEENTSSVKIFSQLKLLFAPSVFSAIGNNCGHKIHSPADFPASAGGYAPPYNALTDEREQLIRFSCNPEGIGVAVGNGRSNQHVFERGHVFRDGTWQEVPLTGDRSPYSELWFMNSAVGFFDFPLDQLDNPNFFLAYICEWNGVAWRCGCQDTLCANPRWNLQIFSN